MAAAKGQHGPALWSGKGNLTRTFSFLRHESSNRVYKNQLCQGLWDIVVQASRNAQTTCEEKKVHTITSPPHGESHEPTKPNQADNILCSSLRPAEKRG
jgi:hypothetical protein